PCLPSFSPPTPTAIYPLSLHDALPIFLPLDALLGLLDRLGGGVELLLGNEGRAALVEPVGPLAHRLGATALAPHALDGRLLGEEDRKSTRLNSSHVETSYAVFSLKQKT